MASKLKKLMELWLKECHKHEAEQKRTITNDMDINGKRKKFVKRSKEKVKRRRNGKRDSLKIGRDNENINCFFSRTRAQKT